MAEAFARPAGRGPVRIDLPLDVQCRYPFDPYLRAVPIAKAARTRPGRPRHGLLLAAEKRC